MTKNARQQDRRTASPAQTLLRIEQRIAHCRERRDALHLERGRLVQQALDLRLGLTAQDAEEYRNLVAMERAAR